MQQQLEWVRPATEPAGPSDNGPHKTVGLLYIVSFCSHRSICLY